MNDIFPVLSLTALLISLNKVLAKYFLFVGKQTNFDSFMFPKHKNDPKWGFFSIKQIKNWLTPFIKILS